MTVEPLVVDRGGAVDVRRVAAGVCGLAAVTFAVGTPVIGAAARPEYSHASQFISELGESGAAGGLLVSLAGFAPTGMLVLLFLALAAPLLPASRWSTVGAISFAAVGVAYIVAAIARCDAGCPATGSLSQSFHNVSGALEYTGAILGLVALRKAFRLSPAWASLAPLCAIAAALVGVGFAAMLTPSLSAIRGVSQRVAEAGVFSFLAAISITLLRKPYVET